MLAGRRLVLDPATISLLGRVFLATGMRGSVLCPINLQVQSGWNCSGTNFHFPNVVS